MYVCMYMCVCVVGDICFFGGHQKLDPSMAGIEEKLIDLRPPERVGLEYQAYDEDRILSRHGTGVSVLLFLLSPSAYLLLGLPPSFLLPTNCREAKAEIVMNGGVNPNC